MLSADISTPLLFCSSVDNVEYIQKLVSLQKQTDFPPVALRRRNPKQQAENPSVFAG